MPTVFRAPDPLQGTFLIPGGNTVGNGVQLFTYVAGSSTKTTVYQDSGGSSAWTNPIVLDSGGNLPSGGEIWIPTGITIDAVYAPSNDTDPPASPYRTLQDVAGINDVSSSTSDWVTGPTPTYVSGTQFTLAGDQTANFKVGRRVRTTNTSGTIYSRITSVSFGGGLTTVNVVSDSGTLDSGLSAVFYALIDPQYTSITEYAVAKDGGSVASAGNATTNIWGVPGTMVHVTGTNNIAYFSTAAYAGAWRDVIFDGALTLTHNASTLALPTLANISVLAGDRVRVLASTAANAVVTQYQRATGAPVGPFSDINPVVVGGTDATKKIRFEVDGLTTATTRVITVPDANVTLLIEAATQAVMESGTDITRATTPGRQQYHPSAAKAWGEVTTVGTFAAVYGMSSVDDDGVGFFTVHYSPDFSSTSFCVVATAMFAYAVSTATTLVCMETTSVRTADTSQINVLRISDAIRTDPTTTSVACFGDQA